MIEATTTSALLLALDAAARRQEAGTSNIANAATDGYAPLRVSFEEQLERARHDLAEHGRIEAASLAGVRAVIEADPGTDAAAPLDAQVADLAANAVHYQALLNGLSRHLSILAAAAADGRRG